MLLGGLYLIWCDIEITTSSVETLILVLVYVYFIKNFVTDYCHSMEAISNGQGSLEKLKVSFRELSSKSFNFISIFRIRLERSSTLSSQESAQSTLES